MCLPPAQIRIAALNAASSAADESQDPLRSSKSRTKEAQVRNYLTGPEHLYIFECV